MDNKKIFLAPGAHIVGNVSLGENVGIWYNAVVRADMESITIGNNTNIQDNCTLHTGNGFPIVVGEGVTIGHNAIVHGCHIGDNTVIGMGSILLNGAKVGRNCIIGAGSLVTKNTVIPDGSLVMGSPAKIKRNLTWEEKLGNLENSKEYVSVSAEMQKQGVL